jgi:hypothetical protein
MRIEFCHIATLNGPAAMHGMASSALNRTAAGVALISFARGKRRNSNKPTTMHQLNQAAKRDLCARPWTGFTYAHTAPCLFNELKFRTIAVHTSAKSTHEDATAAFDDASRLHVGAKTSGA